MSTPAEIAALVEANYQQVVRVVTYALEDLATLGDEWFVHDDVRLEHIIKRETEEFKFTKSNYSNQVPPYIGFQLSIPQGAKMTTFAIWVRDVDQNVARNRRATIGALQRLRDTRHLQTIQVYATQY